MDHQRQHNTQHVENRYNANQGTYLTPGEFHFVVLIWDYGMHRNTSHVARRKLIRRKARGARNGVGMMYASCVEAGNHTASHQFIILVLASLSKPTRQLFLWLCSAVKPEREVNTGRHTWRTACRGVFMYKYTSTPWIKWEVLGLFFMQVISFRITLCLIDAMCLSSFTESRGSTKLHQEPSFKTIT